MLTAETLKKLEERQAALADIFIAETDPAKWPDGETRDARGDRFWHKKNAGATATLIVRIQSILDVALKRHLADPTKPVPGDEEEEAEPAGAMAAAAMAEANEIIGRHKGRFRKS